MKGKKKVTLYIIAAVMVMFALVGCGSNAAGQVEASQQVQATETQPAPEIEQNSLSENVSDIGADKVKQIVLDKVPGAVEESIYEFERGIDDGRLEYEGSIYHNGYEYEFEVDGATGSILKWEIDD